MSKQQQMNDILTKTSAQYDKFNERQQAFAVKEITRTRLDLNDLLADYAKNDNTISKARINSLLRELQVIEDAIEKNGMDAMVTVIGEAGERGIQAGGRALAVAGDTGISGPAFNRINKDVFRYVTERFSHDGLVLSDRVWSVAGDIREELSTVIRSGIIRGQSVNTITAQVRQVYANETWKIKRMVRTEGNIAYRTASSYRAQRSEVVKGLRIHRGEAENPKHKCSILAAKDSYGLGVGVYPVDNTAILNPHPNCTSWTEYVLKDQYA